MVRPLPEPEGDLRWQDRLQVRQRTDFGELVPDAGVCVVGGSTRGGDVGGGCGELVPGVAAVGYL